MLFNGLPAVQGIALGQVETGSRTPEYIQSKSFPDNDNVFRINNMGDVVQVGSLQRYQSSAPASCKSALELLLTM